LFYITQDFTWLKSIEMRDCELRKYIDTIKATIVDNTTLNIAIKQHFDILVLIQMIVGDKISYDKKFKYYIYNKLKIGEKVEPF
jgi:hypothetical protein